MILRATRRPQVSGALPEYFDVITLPRHLFSTFSRMRPPTIRLISRKPIRPNQMIGPIIPGTMALTNIAVSSKHSPPNNIPDVLL